jgi:hypothetical protein
MSMPLPLPLLLELLLPGLSPAPSMRRLMYVLPSEGFET